MAVTTLTGAPASAALAADSARLFENSPEPPLVGSTDFSLPTWEKVKARGIAAQWSGPESDDPKLRLEFLQGARSYGFELVDLDDAAAIAQLAAMSPPRHPLQPQQLLVADALNALGPDSMPLDEYTVEMPRRSSKTTSIFIWCHGRCLARPGYKVTFSAQNGVKSSQRLREWGSDLDRIEPPTDLDLNGWRQGLSAHRSRFHTGQAFDLWGDRGEPNTETPVDYVRGFRVMRGMTNQGIEYRNGSKLLVLKPDPEAYRGEAADVSWIDEAQEIDPEEGADLLAGIVPLQDTRPGACLVVSGTAGDGRVGIFWERLNRIRSADPDTGGIDFAAPEETPWEVVEDEDKAIELLLDVHPGVGTLTTEAKMRKNHRKMPKPQWAREYLSMWPETYGNVAIPADLWQAGALEKKPPRPQRVAFGFAIKPGGAAAAIVAAWRSPTGNAYLEVVDHRSGTQWMPQRMQELTRAFRGSTVAYDDIGEGKTTAAECLVLKPQPALRSLPYSEIAAGCVQILRDLDRGKLRHSDQVGLNAAVAIAAKREVRGSDRGIWLWTPAEKGGDITCLDAATRALRNWDLHYAGRTKPRAPIMGK